LRFDDSRKTRMLQGLRVFLHPEISLPIKNPQRQALRGIPSNRQHDK
jgi:hypothetical protein